MEKRRIERIVTFVFEIGEKLARQLDEGVIVTIICDNADRYLGE
jgi:cysteine synthase